MKKFFATMQAFLACALSATAQTAVDWNSQPLSSIVSQRQADVYLDFDQLSDEQQLMLYNRKSDMFMSTGADYGTRGVLDSQGYPFYITQLEGSNDRYLLWSQSVASAKNNGNVIGFYRKGRGVFFDRPEDKGSKWKITLKKQDGNHYFYQLSATPTDLTTEMYLAATDSGKVAENADANSEYTLWEFVSKADVKAEIEKRLTVADGANLVDVSLLLFDPNFIKNNRYGMYWQNNNSNADAKIDYKKWVWTGNENDFRTGTGKYTDVANDYTMTGSIYYWTQPYGKYQTGQISGNGKLSQTVTVSNGGWYRVSVEGWRQNIDAKFFVYTTSGDTITKPLEVPFSESKADWQWNQNDGVNRGLTNEFSWYPVILGETFSNNDKYRVEKDVYIPKDAQLTFGVEAANKGNDGIAIFDNFKLEYIGRSYLYLDEDASDIQYMKDEANDNTSEYNTYSRLYLYRTLNPGVWNGLVLPVNVTGKQLRDAFGQDVKLAVCKGTTNYETTVRFETVDVSSDADVVLNAYELYLIKPNTDKAQTTPTHYVNKSGKRIEVKAPYYIFDDMKIDATYLDSNNAERLTTDTYGVQKGDGVTFLGTLVMKQNGLDAGNYVFTKDGNLSRLTSPRNIYGFRCWIEDNTAGAPAKSFDELITIDNNGVTEIENIRNVAVDKASDKVYNLQGALVGTRSDLDRLPRGVYVVNGKKYVVK